VGLFEVPLLQSSDESRDVVVGRASLHAGGIRAVEAAVCLQERLRPIRETVTDLAGIVDDRVGMHRGNFPARADYQRAGYRDRTIGTYPLALTTADTEDVIGSRDPVLRIHSQSTGGTADHALLAAGTALTIDVDKGVVGNRGKPRT
jgi:hypothetical protein